MEISQEVVSEVKKCIKCYMQCFKSHNGYILHYDAYIPLYHSQTLYMLTCRPLTVKRFTA